MAYRQTEFHGVVSGHLVGVFFVIGVSITDTYGQTGSGSYDVPRTADGHPDLQGFGRTRPILHLNGPRMLRRLSIRKKRLWRLKRVEL